MSVLSLPGFRELKPELQRECAFIKIIQKQYALNFTLHLPPTNKGILFNCSTEGGIEISYCSAKGKIKPS